MYGTGLLKGLGITMKNLVMPSRMFTLNQYPDRKVSLMELAKMRDTSAISLALKEPGTAFKTLVGLVSVPDRMPQHGRFRGEEFSWYEQRCTGCASCAKYCPLGIIRIVTHPSGAEEQVPEGDKYAIDVFDIDIGRCMFCGLCVEACPYDALHMGSGFEEGKYRRHDLIISKQMLNESPKKPSLWFRPQIEDKGYHPHRHDDIPWQEAGRHERPTVEQQEERWTER